MPNSMRQSRSGKNWSWSPHGDGRASPPCGAGTPESGPTALVFRTGCTYRQRLEQVFTEFGWPSSARFELGTLDGMIGCVAADMGVTMLPRAVVGRNDTVSIHTLNPTQSKVETLFITRRTAHQYSALQGLPRPA